MWILFGYKAQVKGQMVQKRHYCQDEKDKIAGPRILKKKKKKKLEREN